MQKVIFLIASLIMLSSQRSAAQNFSISGTVKDNTAAVTATASLLNAADSSWLQSVLTEESGSYSFKNIKAGAYLLDAQALGYTRALQAVTVNNKDVTLNIALQKSSQALAEVTIKGNKPFIETALGKTIINVEQSITATGGNVLDLLRKSPGITVTEGGNISMQGKQGVMIMVDDRQTYLSGEELEQFLKSMTADQVAKLELISQPSSKYEAEGNAGIINIKTKRTKKAGFNGTAGAEYTQGKFPIHEESLNMNYRNNKLSLWLYAVNACNYGYLTQDLTRTYRDFDTYAVTGNMTQHMYVWEKAKGNDVNIGADYNLTNKTTIGCDIRSNYNPVPFGNTTTSEIYDVATNTTIYNKADLTADQLRKRATANTFMRHTFNKNNELRLSFDYIKYWMISDSYFENVDRDAAGNIVGTPLILRGNRPTDIDVYSVKADHSATLGKVSLEAGVKSSYVNTDNEAYFEQLNNGVWEVDRTRSNHFLYTENINALYTSASCAPNSKWQLQAGLRAENTNATGLQTVNSERFVRSYTSLFPTAYASYKIDSNNQLELNYGRRVNRPEYRSLNPFIRFITQYNYDLGNPELQPAYSHNIELKHAYKGKLFTTLGYRHIDGIREHTISVDDSSKIAYAQPRNIGTNDVANISVMYNSQPFKWWELSLSVNAYYTKYKAVLNDRPAEVDGHGFNFNFNSQFDLGKDWVAECHMGYNDRSKEDLISVAAANLYPSLGFSKKILQDTTTIKVNIVDPFHTYSYSRETKLNELDSRSYIKYNTQLFTIGITYSFGKQMENQRRRENAVQEESRRM